MGLKRKEPCTQQQTRRGRSINRLPTQPCRLSHTLEHQHSEQYSYNSSTIATTKNNMAHESGMFSVRRPREVSSLSAIPSYCIASKHLLTLRADPRPNDQQLYGDSNAFVCDEAPELHLQYAGRSVPIRTKPRALTIRVTHVSRARSPKPAHLPALFVWHKPR